MLEVGCAKFAALRAGEFLMPRLLPRRLRAAVHARCCASYAGLMNVEGLMLDVGCVEFAAVSVTAES